MFYLQLLVNDFIMTEKQVQGLFASRYGAIFQCFAAPGRINIIGEHTDYNMGFVLPASIDKRIYLAIGPSANGEVRLTAADFNEEVVFDAADTSPKLPHWAKYPFGVIKELEAIGHKPKAFSAVFGGDIPEGAGLSSSAALESVFALALNSINGFGLTREDLARVGQKAEHNYAGVRCGIMDQFASLFGEPNRVIRLDCRSLAFEYVPFNLPGYELVLADTRVKHSLASSEYNVRREQCEEGVSIIAAQMGNVKSLRDATPEVVNRYKHLMPTKVADRCMYVVAENQRLLNACDALVSGNAAEVGRLMYGSHTGLKVQYEVSCPELDLLVDIASTIPQVMGARMMGGGFGGCTINLIQANAVDTFIAKASEGFELKYGMKPLFYRVSIGSGASMRERVIS